MSGTREDHRRDVATAMLAALIAKAKVGEPGPPQVKQAIDLADSLLEELDKDKSKPRIEGASIPM